MKKRPAAITLALLLALLISIRAVAPAMILDHLNGHLGSFSPLYGLQIRDLDLHFLRMAYTFEGTRGTLKKSGFEFLSIKRVDVSLAWRELFRGRFVADVDVTEADLKLTTASIKALSGQGAERIAADAKDVKDTTVPFDLERLRCINSRFLFADVAGLPPEQGFQLSQVEAIAHNLTPADEDGLSLFVATGAIQGTAKIKLVGQARTKQDPPDWSINVEMREFDLRKLNPVARRVVPITFKKGRMSLYSAAQSLDGELRGYVKPFFRDLVIVGDRMDFKNVNQVLVEIAGTVGNFILKNNESGALATKVSFRSEGGKVKVDTGKAIALSLENAFGDPLAPSLDETLDLE